MSQMLTIIITAVVTSVFTNYFAFLKEKKVKSLSYTDKSLVKIYIPIYKILTEGLIPGEGYEGVYSNQVFKITKILEDNPEYVDPELEGIVFQYEEEILLALSTTTDTSEMDGMLLDEDRRLLDYILTSFHKTRKSLGLPYNKVYADEVYIWIEQWKSKRQRRNIEKKLKSK
ncbi:hypothetical protein [Halobacillus yeomjeoni]|uniref:Uncharacterized protein n=1 Tax=Halobacillus yeomjeoni TaxID=311194 RepID=A0A931MTV6_9BACI|nr:hypothetical protein [Halobacillus yeomjeoni]MBH0228841.1 hypothetical protein [Halobacillus yeomjeoni]